MAQTEHYTCYVRCVRKVKIHHL